MKSNKTVLHYTVQDGNVSLLRYFLELNAFKSKDFVNNKVIFVNNDGFFTGGKGKSCKSELLFNPKLHFPVNRQLTREAAPALNSVLKSRALVQQEMKDEKEISREEEKYEKWLLEEEHEL